jgi:hypothetical protein
MDGTAKSSPFSECLIVKVEGDLVMEREEGKQEVF